jgi:hypothetical protein
MKSIIRISEEGIPHFQIRSLYRRLPCPLLFP